jgi:hypothetical protein
MIPLIFIIIVIGLGMVISCYFSSDSEITWFTYYKGGIVGVFVSGVMLEFWTGIKKRREEKEGKR